MKKGLMFLLIVLLIMSVAACGSKEEGTTELQSLNAVVQEAEPTVKAEESQTSQISENSAEETEEEQTDAVGEQTVMEYLGILGLDENAKYTVLDQFSIEGSDEKSILMDINNIAKDQFDAVIQAMENNGCYSVSDPMINEEKQTTSLQYRNEDDTLYIEMVYSAGADYINIIFTPINLSGGEA